MSDQNQQDPQPIIPSRRDRLRPLELVGFAAVLSVFASLIVILTTRDMQLMLISFGIAFIVALLVLALLGLGKAPSQEDVEAAKDLRRPDTDDWH